MLKLQYAVVLVFVGACAGGATEEQMTDRVMSYSFAERQSSAYTCGDVAPFSGPATAICSRAVKNQTPEDVLCDDLADQVYIREMYVDPKPATDGTLHGILQVVSDDCEGVYDVTVR